MKTIALASSSERPRRPIPAAQAILAAATAGDPLRELEVLGAARQSIEARIKLWGGLLTALNDFKQARTAAPYARALRS
jgi:hypothetical protein